MRRGKAATPSSAAGVAAAAASVAKEDEQQQPAAAAASSPAKTSSGATSSSSPGEGGVGDAPGDTAAATTTAGGTIAHPYENSIKTIATVTTVEEFWQVYDYLKRPADLPTTTDYHLFRSGIKPTWEDPGNARGGKWIVRLPKGLASRYWEEIVLALVGGQLAAPAASNSIMSGGGSGPSLLPDGEICGAVLSIRYSEDILALWNRTVSVLFVLVLHVAAFLLYLLAFGYWAA
jgi:translation initiation factor 4E